VGNCNKLKINRFVCREGKNRRLLLKAPLIDVWLVVRTCRHERIERLEMNSGKRLGEKERRDLLTGYDSRSRTF